jgi:hypothetical protein
MGQKKPGAALTENKVANAIFITWRNAITKNKVGNMPLQTTHISIYAILFT